MLIPLPALEAYRRDLQKTGREAFGEGDAEWLLTAVSIEHQSLSPSPQSVLLLVEAMEEAGAYRLAFSTLASLRTRLSSSDRLERGRVLALQARISWKAGDTVGAESRYGVLAREGRGVPELLVRAWLGKSVLAQLRGNYPALRRNAARAARVAKVAGLSTLEGLAHHFLMVAAMAAGDVSAGLIHGWHAYQSAAGECAEEAERLLNLAQLLLETNRPRQAAVGFRAALQLNPPARIVLPALGGLAVSAATLRDEHVVRSAVREVTRLAKAASLPYHLASAWTEVAWALGEIGDVGASTQARATANALASAHGFHEVTHRLETMPAPRRASSEQQVAPDAPVPTRISREAKRVVHAVASLHSDSLQWDAEPA